MDKYLGGEDRRYILRLEEEIRRLKLRCGCCKYRHTDGQVPRPEGRRIAAELELEEKLNG